MTEQELVARADDLIAAWNAGDIDRIVVAHRVDALVRGLQPGGLSGTGREIVRADAEQLLAAIPDLRLELRRAIVGDNVVVQECVATGTANGNGSFERDLVAITEFDRAGRISAASRHW